MLLIETKLGLSTVHGIGLFANQFIKKGEVIWRFTPGFDIEVSAEDLLQLSLPARNQFLKYCYQSAKGIYILCFDDSRFLNHSEDPNVVDKDQTSEEEIDIAARDIQIGEELLTDYKSYDYDYKRKFSLK